MRVVIKTLAWGLAALTVLGVVAPAVMGWVLAKRFDRVVARLSVPGYLAVVDRSFDEGWFSSHARVVLRPLGPLCHTQPCPTIAFASRIDHGPLAWRSDQASLTPVFAVIHTRADPTELWPGATFAPAPGPLEITSLIEWDTRGHARLRLAGVSFDVARGKPIAHLKTATVSGQLAIGMLGRGVDRLALNWPSFALVRQTGGHLGWRGLRFRIGPGPGGRLTRRSLTGDSFTLDNGRGRSMRLGDFRLSMHDRADGDTAITLRVRKLLLPAGIHGSLVFKAAESGLKPAGWAALPEHWQQLGGWSGGALDEPALYRRILPGLAAGGAELHIGRVNLATSTGTIQLKADVYAPASPITANTAADFLSALDLDLRLSLPRSFVRRLVAHTIAGPQSEHNVDARIAALVDRRLIVPGDSGQRYATRLRLRHGQMRINGRKRPRWRRLVAQFQAAAQGA